MSSQDHFLIRQRFWEAGGGSCQATPLSNEFFGQGALALDWREASFLQQHPASPRLMTQQMGGTDTTGHRAALLSLDQILTMRTQIIPPLKVPYHEKRWEMGWGEAMQEAGPLIAWCQNKIGMSASWPRGSKTVVGFYRMRWTILHCVWILRIRR